MKSVVTNDESCLLEPDRLLTEREVADYLHLSTATLQRWRWKRKYLPFIHVGPSVRYKGKDIMDYLERQRKPVVEDGEIIR